MLQPETHYGDALPEEVDLNHEDKAQPNNDEAEVTHVYFNDYQRVKAARANQAAFETLMSEYAGMIRGIASEYFLMGGDRNDLLQEARIGFYKAVKDYDGIHSPFDSFASLVIRRNVITAIKTASRFKHQPLNQAISFEHEIAGGHDDGAITLEDMLRSPNSSVDEIVEGHEAIQNLVFFLAASMSRLESEVLRLYLNQESYQTMATELNISTKTVDNALQRVKRKMTGHLAA